MSLQDANNRCLPHRLGRDLRGTLKSKSVAEPSSLMARQPSGDVGCISCFQEFPSKSQGPPCACPLRQHIGGLLYKSPEGFVVTSTLKTGVPNPPVVPREVVVSSSNFRPWGPQYRSRHPVETGAEARGMEAPPRGGGADMEGVRPGTSGSVCVSRDVSLSTLVLPHSSSSSQTGCDDTDVAEALSLYAFPPIVLLPGVLESVRRDRVPLLLIAPWWLGRVWFPDLLSLIDRPPLELPVRRDLLSQAGGSIFHPHPELWKLWAWPLRGPSS